jgi:hypothetical protein
MPRLIACVLVQRSVAAELRGGRGSGRGALRQASKQSSTRDLNHAAAGSPLKRWVYMKRWGIAGTAPHRGCDLRGRASAQRRCALLCTLAAAVSSVPPWGTVTSSAE